MRTTDTFTLLHVIKRKIRSATILGALILTLTVTPPVFGQDVEDDVSPNPLEVENPTAEFFQTSTSLREWLATLRSQRRPKDPPVPQLPEKFRWTGRYVVSDLVDPRTGKLGITVPFEWWGQDGNTQMTAGRPGDPVFFTNFIWNGYLFTYTFAWPQLQPRFIFPRPSVLPVGQFTMSDLNAFFATSRYVGKVILQEKEYRYVNHFRLSLVLPQNPPGFRRRFALALADIFVQQNDSTKFRQVLHFGYHNLYDPELDEWIIIDKIERGGGQLTLPQGVSLP